MTYLIVFVMAAIALALLWAWWAGRIGRDPAGSVDHFHRALAAMQPADQRSDAGDTTDVRGASNGDRGHADTDPAGSARPVDAQRPADAPPSPDRER